MHLIDSDVLSYAINKHPRGQTLLGKIPPGAQLGITFATLAEILSAPTCKRWGQNKTAQLHSLLRRLITVHSSPDICATYSALWVGLRALNQLIPDNDLWNAACAVALGVPLVSGNKNHLARVPGLQLLTD
jgi:predicted nucleic acid-binding protein